MTATGARQELHARLVALEQAARRERQRKGLHHSRREVAKVAAQELNVSFDAQRISSWVPKDAVDAQVPPESEPAAFLAMVQVWSAWAGQTYRKHEWTTLLADARGERGNARPATAVLHPTLPAIPAGFSGRADEVDAVLDALTPDSTGPTAVCVAGPPGVGKTALALVAAHRAQKLKICTTAIFVDLLGYHDTPADAADILAILLRGLGADMTNVGPSAAEREAVYRARLTELTGEGQTVLIVADNASDAATVRPLQPPSGPHRLLVTSRETLDTLDARLIDLPVLPDDASVKLLVKTLCNADRTDPRAQSPVDDLTALARLCGGLPLALRIAAALLIRDPHLTIAELIQELLDLGPLDGLDDGENSVRATLELSYRRLSPELAEVFRLLVLNPGPDLSTEAAEVVTGLRRPVLRRRLVELARAHLLDRVLVAGRWRMHDLIRAFALERVHAHPPSAEGAYGRAQQQRLLQHYWKRLDAADVWIRGLVPKTHLPQSFPDRYQALRWLDAEHANLVGAVEAAAATGNPELAVSLALGLAEYLQVSLQQDEAAQMLRVAERVAPTPYGRAQLLDTLGHTFTAAGRFEEAIALHEQALELFREQGSELEEGLSLMNIGIALRNAGRPKDAIVSHRKARTIFERIGVSYHLAAAWHNLAAAWRDDHAFDQALRAVDQALALSQHVGNAKSEVRALFTRSSVLFARKDHQKDALDTIRLAIARAGEGMVTLAELDTHMTTLGPALEAVGQTPEECRTALESAAAVFDECGLPDIGNFAREYAERYNQNDRTDANDWRNGRLKST